MIDMMAVMYSTDVRTLDPDFTKVTPEEADEIKKAEESGFVDEADIDWDNLQRYAG